MSTIHPVSEQEAQGEVKALYGKIKEMMNGELPVTFKVMANHPAYMKIVLQKMQLVMGSGEIDRKTKLAIAFAVSVMNNCEMCITMYTKQLKEAGFTEKQIVEILSVIDLVGSMNHFNNGAIVKPEG